MQAILPGKPEARLHAVDYGTFEGQLVLAYISGHALVILNGPESLLQTIYHDELDTERLLAVAYDRSTGKIAAAAARTVYVYAVREEIKGTLRWALEVTLSMPATDRGICTLSWGSDEELLVGSDSLTLFSTHINTPPSSPVLSSSRDSLSLFKPVWARPVASPPSHASFSPTASLVATTASCDCLVKIWRRLSFESAQFDYAYLRHPATVTHLEWRRAGDLGGEGAYGEEDVLYTICADGKFRVWRASDPHSIDILSLYAEIDMVSSIRPRVPADNATAPRRYAFLLNAATLDKTVAGMEANENEKACSEKDRHALEYVREIASRHPDIFVVLDDHGHMSAWGLENVSCKKRNSGVVKLEPFHVAHVEGTSFAFESGAAASEDNSRLQAFSAPGSPGELVVLAHHFDGRMMWWQGAVQNLFDPGFRSQRVRNVVTWSGHSAAIKKVIRTASGKALISRTQDNEGLVWARKAGSKIVQRKSAMMLQEHIHRTALLREGDFVVFLHHDSISLWDARSRQAIEIARCKYSVRRKPLCLLLLPGTDASDGLVHLATVSADMQGIVWELKLPAGKVDASTATNGDEASMGCSMTEFCTFQLDSIDNLSYFLPVDPAGSAPTMSGFLDSFAQDVAMSYTTNGLLTTWAVKIDSEARSVDWLTTATIDTRVDSPSLGSATSIRKAALVDKDRSTLTIWDTRSGRLDHEEVFPHQVIQDLDWASTPDNQSILAVGFPHRVLVYTQLRYDYVNERPAWARIKEVNILELTPHPIGDSVWLGDGSLVIGSGNQLFVASNSVDLVRDLDPDLRSAVPHQRATHVYQLVRTLNGPLPVFHPQFLSQCVLGGKMDLVHRILVSLHKTLKFYTEGDELDSFQGVQIEDFLFGLAADSATQKSYSILASDDEPSNVTEELADSLTSLLSQKSIPQLTSTEQFSLADITDCVATVEKHRRSIDENATRFLLFWRESVLRSGQGLNSASKSRSLPTISWREIVWAYHSSSQDILFDLISRHHKGRVEWTHARASGVFSWLTDREALLAHFEAVARNAYSTNDPKDPVDCSLYYLALRKKAVLIGLWRMATWSREQAATMKLLRNDFTDPRWKTAAAKNAYALMGKRRFEYAAAFFLLADDPASAVSVLSNQHGDTHLAIAVARVYAGDDSPILKTFLTTRILPAAAEAGNRWQSTWAYWLLSRRADAVRALVSPLHALLDAPIPAPAESLQAKSFLNDDPALVVLYAQLRATSLQTLRGALMVSGAEEWAFVTKTAALLRRMGCEVLALDLVANWEFLVVPMPQQQPRVTSVDEEEEANERTETIAELVQSPKVTARSGVRDGLESDPRRMLRRRSSLVVADLPSPAVDGRTPPSLLDGYGLGAGPVPSKKPPPPSMLDAFEFPETPAAGKSAPTNRPPPPSMLDGFDFGSGTTSKNGDITESKDAELNKDEKKGDTTKQAGDKMKQAGANGNKKKPPPTQFKEPDSNSLLDAFGF